jgi:7-carboxy-7-deazaguanine synthase (Cx14CxxC type)
MTYAVKELFYTLQGEGLHAGRPAVFLRFAGCNLWSGREQDRATGAGGCARWCDTDFVGTNGLGGGKFETPVALAAAVARSWTASGGRKFVVCTGGEPLLQLDEALVAALHDEGFTVAIETNGTKPVPRGVDWVCVSPKVGGDLVVRSGHELKLVYPQVGLEPTTLEELNFEHHLLQPLDGPDRAANARLAVEFCLAHPRWRLSIQSHKYLGIP